MRSVQCLYPLRFEALHIRSTVIVCGIVLGKETKKKPKYLISNSLNFTNRKSRHRKNVVARVKEFHSRDSNQRKRFLRSNALTVWFSLQSSLAAFVFSAVVQDVQNFSVSKRNKHLNFSYGFIKRSTYNNMMNLSECKIFN